MVMGTLSRNESLGPPFGSLLQESPAIVPGSLRESSRTSCRCVYDFAVPKRPRLSIALLGAPLAEIDGRPLVVDTRKAIALLAYLAVTDRPARRDTLAGLLWPETKPERARSALRRTLSTLRSALGGRWLDAGRELVTLEREDVVLDLAEFRRLVAECEGHGHTRAETCDRCLTPLRQAVALDRGPFLAGFGLRDSVEFDDWQQLVGEEVQRDLGVALDRLAEVLAARGDHTEAISVARRRLALDPLHEPAHRRLIRVYAECGDRSAALEQYRACVRTLDRELGVRPLDETTTLYHAIVEGSLAPVTRQPDHPSPRASVSGPPLIGRERERAVLREASDSVGPDGRLVLVVGEAGIGKTRLGEELLSSVERDGGCAIGIRCFQDEVNLEYGVVSQLARAALTAAESHPVDGWWRAEVARLVPELGPATKDALDSIAAQARFYEAVCGLVEAVARSASKAVIFVDDIHWADDASLRLLAYLARRLRARPLLVVLSMRPEDATPGHGAQRLLHEAKRDRQASVLALPRLSLEDVIELMRSRGRDGRLGERLHRQTKGVPFFVIEYLEAIERDPDAASWPLPGGIRDLLAARLATLDELALQVVAAAAVLGRSFDTETVRDTSGRSDEETVQALELLVARGLLVEGADGALDFRHEQARELVVDEMTLARRRLLHRRAAAALGARDRRDLLVAVIARHLELAGDDAAAAELYTAAGARARALYANVEALEHYRTALALGFPDVARIQLEVGDLETLAGDYGSALASYETAAATGETHERARIDHRLGLLHLRRGEWELADVRLAEAEASLVDATAARVLASRSLAAHRAGRPEAAERLARDALTRAEECEDAVAVAQARNVLGILAGSRGDHADAMAQLEASLTLARETGDRSIEVAAENNLALAVAATGDIDRAIDLTGEGLAVCVAIGDRHREAALRNNLADLLHVSGRDDESMEELKRAVAIFAEVGEEGKLEPEIWKLSEW
jgi:DNA-binding SARP family transcriptional activator